MIRDGTETKLVLLNYVNIGVHFQVLFGMLSEFW
jgi:hypothetical protein